MFDIYKHFTARAGKKLIRQRGFQFYELMIYPKRIIRGFALTFSESAACPE
jgi:hypothetical protein